MGKERLSDCIVTLNVQVTKCLLIWYLNTVLHSTLHSPTQAGFVPRNSTDHDFNSTGGS